MFQPRESHRTRNIFLLSGWLFADLMLALMMIFLISISGGSAPPRPCATPAAATPTTTSQAANALVDATNTSASQAPLFPTSTPCPTPKPSSTPTPTPFPCGLDLNHKVDMTKEPITVNDPDGLRQETPSGQKHFDDQIQALFAPYAGKTAGLVEVYGGGPNDPNAGEAFAQNAIDALKKLGDQQPPFIFDRHQTFFQNLWDGDIGGDQVTMFVIFYYQSTNGNCIQQ